jgi:hypothetical protein
LSGQPVIHPCANLCSYAYRTQFNVFRCKLGNKRGTGPEQKLQNSALITAPNGASELLNM